MTATVVIVEGNVWQNQQKGSLAVVIANGPAYNPATDVPHGKHLQFFVEQEVRVQTQTWQVKNAGTVGFFVDVQRAQNAKWFDDAKVWDNPWRPSPRTTTDFLQSSDLFASHDTFGWPEYPYPPFWVNEQRGSQVILNVFPAYPFSRDVFLLRKQEKFFAPEQVWWTPQPALSRSVFDYVPYLNELQRPSAKWFDDERKWWDFKQPITANVLNTFATYNPATDPTQLKLQAKWFDPQAIWWDSAYKVTINTITFLPPPYNPATDVKFPFKQPVYASPNSWDPAAFAWAQRGTAVVINVPQTPPTPPGSFTILQNWESRVIFSPKKLGEALDYPVDFISRLNTGDSIVSALITCTAYSGTDPNAQNMVVGLPTVKGTVVTQLISGGILGNTYELLYTVTTTLGQTVEIAGYLTVIPDVP